MNVFAKEKGRSKYFRLIIVLSIKNKIVILRH